MNYQSSVRYDQARIHAAALYCSDGRVGAHFDDFLQNGLSLPRYDRVSLPGGPACLAGHPQAHLEEQGVVDVLRFLVEVHGRDIYQADEDKKHKNITLRLWLSHPSRTLTTEEVNILLDKLAKRAHEKLVATRI